MEKWIEAALIAVISFLAGRRLSIANANAVDVKSLIDLSSRVEELGKRQLELEQSVLKLESKTRVMWQYIYALVEHIRKHKIRPLTPPAELKSDPVLMKLFTKK